MECRPQGIAGIPPVGEQMQFQRGEAESGFAGKSKLIGCGEADDGGGGAKPGTSMPSQFRLAESRDICA